MLSVLSFNNPNATVTGLEAYPRDTWPSLPITHLAFDTMATLGGLFLLVPIVFWVLYYRRGRTPPTARWLLWALVVCGPLPFLALETGWMAAELGRQPWIIVNIMRTSNGVTTNPGLGFFFFVFLGIYIALAAATISLLLRLAHERKTFAAVATEAAMLE